MSNSLKMNVGGIKCDNEKCDFKDMSVLFEDYDQWLNKPCPKCGRNLLTKRDLDRIKGLMNLTNWLKDILPDSKEDEQLFKMSAEMNGTGKVFFSGITPEGEEK